MIIGGTIFPHRSNQKLTWTSPNGRDQNQIDHRMVNSMWRRSLLDVKVRRGADAASDHHLVTARVRLKLRAAGPKKQINPIYDINGCKTLGLRVPFVLQLKNRFQALSLMDEPEAEEEDPVNQQCKQVRSIFNEARRTLWGDKEDMKTEDKEEERMDNTRNTKDIEERRRLKKKTNDSRSARLQER